MANKEKHPCFQPPSNPNIKIWRYMDFTKYVFFLDSKSLFFSRSDFFDDPYEGAMSHMNIALRPKIYKEIPAEELAKWSIYKEWLRQWTYINCWHMNEHESAAMWKLYAQTHEAVAIQSTYHRLYDCTPDNVFVGIVKYIDYEKELLPEGNSFWPFVHKRKSFEHERELRAIIQDVPFDKEKILTNLSNPEYGRLVPIDPEKLITCVHVSPSSPEWFSELVQKVTKQYGFGFAVKQSLLSKKPLF